jgi:hypothetical protein
VGADTRASQASAVAKPTTIFKRSDTPFLGGGTEVMISLEPGYTKSGWLGVPFRFQFPPLDKWDKTRSASWPGFMVVGGAKGPRERARHEGPKLQTVTFKAMFLNWEPGFEVWAPDELEPQLAAAELEALCQEGVKFRLRIRNAELYDYDDVNMIAVITQADVSEEAGEPDTRYMQLAFQEWEPSAQESKSVKQALGPWTFKPVKGGSENLYGLSKKYYKTTALWRLIVAANPSLKNVPPSSTALYNSTGGHSIKIPPKPTPGDTTGAAAGEPQTTVITL